MPELNTMRRSALDGSKENTHARASSGDLAMIASVTLTSLRKQRAALPRMFRIHSDAALQSDGRALRLQECRPKASRLAAAPARPGPHQIDKTQKERQ